jgi:hypothetical protein
LFGALWVPPERLQYAMMTRYRLGSDVCSGIRVFLADQDGRRREPGNAGPEGGDCGMAVLPLHFPVMGTVVLGGPGQVRASTARRLSHARPASRRRRRYPGCPVLAASGAWKCLADHSSPRPGPYPGSCGHAARTTGPRHEGDLPRRWPSRDAECLAVPCRAAALASRSALPGARGCTCCLSHR